MFGQSTVEQEGQVDTTSDRRITPPSTVTTDQNTVIKHWLTRRFMIAVPAFILAISPPNPLLPYEIKIVFAVLLLQLVVDTIVKYLNRRRQEQFDPEIGDSVGIETEGTVVDTYHDGYIVNIDGTEVRIESETGVDSFEQETP